MMLVLFVALSVASCGYGPTGTTAGGTPFTVELWASAKCVQPGDTLVARATVVNHGPTAQVIELTDRPVLDLSIGYRTLEGSTIIRWSDGKSLTQDLTRLALQPGESKRIELRWVVINPPPSGLGVAATFVVDPKLIDHPVSPYIGINRPGTCSGGFGP